MSNKKEYRKHVLLLDLLDLALRTSCRFALCNGPTAPIRRHQTCVRCACIHRAIRMGLVREVKEQYINKRGYLVAAGVLELVEEP